MKKNMVKLCVLILMLLFQTLLVSAKEVLLQKKLNIQWNVFGLPSASLLFEVSIRQNDRTELAEVIYGKNVRINKSPVIEGTVKDVQAFIENNGNTISITATLSEPINGRTFYTVKIPVPRPKAGNKCDKYGNCMYSIDRSVEIK